MAYKYGVKVVVQDSIGALPVAVSSCVVFFGAAYGSSASLGKAVKCAGYDEYLTHYHSGTAPASELALDEAAKTAFNRVGINHAWFVNCGESLSAESSVSNSTIATYLDSALASICLETSERPNIICVPAIAEHTGSLSDLVSALATICNGGINDSYSAICVLDVSESASQVSAGKAVPAQIVKDSSDGHIIECWGRVITERTSGGAPASAVHLSPVVACMYAVQDEKNEGRVPSRSIGNLNVAWAKGICIKALADGAETLVECTARQKNMTDVCAKGIVTLVNKGSGKINTWGDHTAAFADGGDVDPLYQFDSSARMMIYLFNRFIDKWGSVIDSPMTLSLRNDIVASEQEHLDYLVMVKALIGQPRCEFRPESNTEIALGYFYFDDLYTTTIPSKFIQMNLTHTSEGLRAYTA